jgi:5-(carboxyamino)imidazole ribonucleotide synthase
VILPPATLGLLGGGQLGRMFTMAARTMGYRVVVLDPDPLSPAAEFANEHLCSPYEDPQALAKLAASCAAITTEFENASAASLDALASRRIVRPTGKSVAIAQDRIREKNFLRDNGFPVGPFAIIESAADLPSAAAGVHFPAVLKTARFGYDGKGQVKVANPAEIRQAYAAMQTPACVLEQFLALKCEISVVLARGADGETRCFPVVENQHRHGILDVSIVPARIDADTAESAANHAVRLAQMLDYVGVLAVEFFVLDDHGLLINEIAPRPHNSGHYTIDACVTSQFEQQVRALCGLPLGDTRLHSPVVMVNLLGEIWRQDGAPPWDAILNNPDAKLHLYGKQEARPGRKMGHFSVLASTPDDALRNALDIKRQLGT